MPSDSRDEADSTVKDKTQLHDLQKLASGTQGVVHTMSNVRINQNFDAAYKEYKPSIQVDFGVIAKMASFINSLSFAEGSRLFSLTAWPAEVVSENNRPCGFIMPLVPKQFYTAITLSAGRKETTLGAFQHLLNTEDFLARRGIPLTDRYRYELLASVAEALEFLHGYDIAVGDFSPKNLLFSLETGRPCYFVDCDAMRFQGSSALEQLETPDWRVHDVNPKEPLASKESDRYKFSLLVLRLLSGSQDARSLQGIPSGVDANLRALIDQGISANPNNRPTPQQWIQPLKDAASKASMAPPRLGTTQTNKAVLTVPAAVVASKTSTTPLAPVSAPAPAGSGPNYGLISILAAVLLIIAVIVVNIARGSGGTASLAQASANTPTTTTNGSSSQAGTTQAVSWSQPSIEPNGITSITCPTSTFCVAVDGNNNAFTYNGSIWSQAQSIDPNGGPIQSVSCTSSTFCVAVDGSGNALTYNGSVWSQPSIDPNSITSVTCPTSTFCVAADANGNALTYNGSIWSQAQSIDPNGGSIQSVSCTSSTFCVAVDGNNNVLTYNGSSWSQPQSIDPTGITSVTCPTSTFCMAVDGSGNALIGTKA